MLAGGYPTRNFLAFPPTGSEHGQGCNLAECHWSHGVSPAGRARASQTQDKTLPVLHRGSQPPHTAENLLPAMFLPAPHRAQGQKYDPAEGEQKSKPR